MDGPYRLQVLAQQRTGGVGQVELLAQGPHPDGDLGVTVTGQVGEQVMLDLITQVAAGERPSVNAALRGIRARAHEAEVIGLLSAGEFLDADAENREPSLDAVRLRYEEEIRAGDPSLEPWDTATSDAAITGLRELLDALDERTG